jgi:hypothetical protein
MRGAPGVLQARRFIVILINYYPFQFAPYMGNSVTSAVLPCKLNMIKVS